MLCVIRLRGLFETSACVRRLEGSFLEDQRVGSLLGLYTEQEAGQCTVGILPTFSTAIHQIPLLCDGTWIPERTSRTTSWLYGSTGRFLLILALKVGVAVHGVLERRSTVASSKEKRAQEAKAGSMAAPSTSLLGVRPVFLQDASVQRNYKWCLWCWLQRNK